MRSKLLVLALGLALLVSACGGTSGDAPQCPYGGTGPSISSFSASPSTLPVGGGMVTLSWEIAGATSINIDPDVGDIPDITSISTTVPVTSTTTFQLTASNPVNTSSQQVIVTVASP